MSKATPKQLERLAEFDKEEIIAVLGRYFNAEEVVHRLLPELQLRKVIKKAGRYDVFDALVTAEDVLHEWRSEMIAKYGNGRYVYGESIPPEERARENELEKARGKAERDVRRLYKEIRKREKGGQHHE